MPPRRKSRLDWFNLQPILLIESYVSRAGPPRFSSRIFMRHFSVKCPMPEVGRERSIHLGSGRSILAAAIGATKGGSA